MTRARVEWEREVGRNKGDKRGNKKIGRDGKGQKIGECERDVCVDFILLLTILTIFIDPGMRPMT